MKDHLQAIILVCLLLLSSITLEAKHSQLFISLPSQGFSVSINGVGYDLMHGELALDGLMPGNYHIRVVQHIPVPSRPGMMRTYPVAQQQLHIGPRQRVHAHLGFRKLIIDRRPLHVPELMPHRMGSVQFSALLSSIEQCSFDRNRLELAKQVVRTNGMHADQIAAIARLFSFDSYRLDFAQFAYRHCFDPANYFMVAETLNFQSNVRRLYASIGD